MTNRVASALAIKRCPHVFSADVSVSLTGSRRLFPKRSDGKRGKSGRRSHLPGTRAQRTSQVRQFVSITVTLCHWAVSVKDGSICSHTATPRISSLVLSVNLLRITNTPSCPLLSHEKVFTGGHLVSRQAPPTKDLPPPPPAPPCPTCSQSLPSIRSE